MIVPSLLIGIVVLAAAARVEWRRRGAPRPPHPTTSAPETAVLLPVRDEEENAAPCLQTLLAQTAHPRIRVVDDGSTDATPAIIAGLAREHPALEVVTLRGAAEGWNGKVHALHEGAHGLTEPWLLLTDADTRHHPAALATAHAAAREWGLDALSLAGTQATRGPGEALLSPGVFALLDALLPSWTAAANGGSGVLNGQFILLRREALERVGGFASIRAEQMDDVALCARLRERGFRCGFVRAPRLLSTRMYQGLRSTWRGWRRNLAGLIATGALPALPLALFLLAPVLALLLLLVSGHWVPALVIWAGGALGSLLLRSERGAAALVGLIYPLDAALLGALLLAAAVDVRLGRRLPWRGRTVAADLPRRHPERSEGSRVRPAPARDSSLRSEGVMNRSRAEHRRG